MAPNEGRVVEDATHLRAAVQRSQGVQHEDALPVCAGPALRERRLHVDALVVVDGAQHFVPTEAGQQLLGQLGHRPEVRVAVRRDRGVLPLLEVRVAQLAHQTLGDQHRGHRRKPLGGRLQAVKLRGLGFLARRSQQAVATTRFPQHRHQHIGDLSLARCSGEGQVSGKAVKVLLLGKLPIVHHSAKRSLQGRWHRDRRAIKLPDKAPSLRVDQDSEEILLLPTEIDYLPLVKQSPGYMRQVDERTHASVQPIEEVVPRVRDLPAPPVVVEQRGIAVPGVQDFNPEAGSETQDLLADGGPVHTLLGGQHDLLQLLLERRDPDLVRGRTGGSGSGRHRRRRCRRARR
mmetsp:Transcript_107936/g.344572  ORF Transcript_107936/g.344572 Transcript_107936/m.344572 type:complete len:346 (+) Transcript_107936:460-1497(+)